MYNFRFCLIFFPLEIFLKNFFITCYKISCIHRGLTWGIFLRQREDSNEVQKKRRREEYETDMHTAGAINWPQEGETGQTSQLPGTVLPKYDHKDIFVIFINYPKYVYNFSLHSDFKKFKILKTMLFHYC